MPSVIKLFGYMGVIPLIYFAFAIWLPVLNVLSLDLVTLFKFYSVVALSFIAGAIWPLAFIEPFKGSVRIVVTAMGFALVGWGTLLIDIKAALFVLGFAYIALWKTEENIGLNKLYPSWYQELRAKLTLIVAICHAATWLHTQ